MSFVNIVRFIGGNVQPSLCFKFISVTWSEFFLRPVVFTKRPTAVTPLKALQLAGRFPTVAASSSVAAKPTVVALNPARALFFERKASLCKGYHAMRGHGPGARFSPVSIPNVGAILVPLRARCSPFPVFRSTIVFRLGVEGVGDYAVLNGAKV